MALTFTGIKTDTTNTNPSKNLANINRICQIVCAGPNELKIFDKITRYPMKINFVVISLYPRPTKLEGGYTGFTLSVRLSVRPSVCRRQGFRSISQVSFGISISYFICMLMVAIGRSLLIFSEVTFKMAAWRPYWIFGFPDSNFGFEYQL